MQVYNLGMKCTVSHESVFWPMHNGHMTESHRSRKIKEKWGWCHS